jgi:hypothetical protein
MPHIMLRPLALKRARGGRHNGALAHQNCVLEHLLFIAIRVVMAMILPS